MFVVGALKLNKENSCKELPNPKNSKATSSAVRNIQVVPLKNQPSNTFSFPVTAGRKCKAEWFASHQWLHYDPDKDCVLCYTCMTASHMVSEHNTSWFHGVEQTFLSTGFKNWKKATEKFRDHEKSNFHQKNVHLIFSRTHIKPVNAQLDIGASKEQKNARKCLLTIISSLRYLMRTGNSVRSHDHNEGNLIELLEERCLDVPELNQWLARRNKFLSSDIQNEIIEIMAHNVLREIVREVKNSPFFGVIADSTTDVHGMEQFSLCLRFVHPESLEINEVFAGLYNPVDSKGKTLASAIKDALLRLNLSLDNLRGHCFDGAANMSGREKGVQKILIDEQTKSLYVHCANHAADLALQEVARKTGGMCDILCLVKDSSNIILDSSKRRNIYADVVLPPCSGSEEVMLGTPQQPRQQLIPLCPTRWCVRVKSLKRFKQQYSTVQRTLQAIIDDPGASPPEKKATIRGYVRKMNGFGSMFYLIVSIEIFCPCEQLARALQNPRITATGAKQAARLLINRLETLRSDKEFHRLFDEAFVAADELNLDHPIEPKSRKPPQHREQIENPAFPAKLSAKDLFRKDYFEILDLLSNKLKERFDQKGLNTLEMLEDILLAAFKGNVFAEDDLKKRLGVHAEDFQISDLHAQLKMLKNMPGDPPSSCASVVEQLCEVSDTTKCLLKQVLLLVVLIMTVPASAASSERSFSALRRLKTYMRATMKQKRLTHVMLLHVHKDRTRNLNLNDILREFVSRKDERKVIFGKGD